MRTAPDLKDVDTHFAFGKNWASYAAGISDVQIDAAVADLRRLLGAASLEGRRFLDIGCGSGLHSLAALRLGAAHVVAVDIDPDSVATTTAVLARFAPNASLVVQQCSVFDLPHAGFGTFDVVYSWGVLHHTGDLDGALRQAAAMVAPGGVFLFALYRRTWLCPFWRAEKRWYAAAAPSRQRVAQHLFVGWHRGLRALATVSRAVTGRGRVVSTAPNRGMEYYHDVHDWLGGFPYESILPGDVRQHMTRLGLVHDATFPCTPSPGKTHGLLGSGCDEYRYRREAASSS